jgi:hypothetical protein
LLDEVLPAGTVVRLTGDARSQTSWIAIDLVDFEMVPPPLRRPAGSLSVVDFGADPNGELDSREAFSKGIAAASSSGRPLWVPPGHFRLDGLWLDGPFGGLVVKHIRVLDTTADGLNLHRGVSNVIVEDSFFRNNGDDGIASWAEKLANHDIIIRHNTVVAPILANGVAIYGGHAIAVSDNLIADTLTEGGGLHLGNRFDAVPLSGMISLKGNMVVRGGSVDPRWHIGVGAVWL